MITFFPGPSRVYSQLAQYMQDAFNEGILSISHRSDAFNRLSQETITLLKEKLAIPAEYSVFYTSSATENWEIVSQSLVNHKTLHFYNGAFGEKWFGYAQKLKPSSIGHSFGINDSLKPLEWQLQGDEEVICLTQNETSTATQITPDLLRAIRYKYKQPLLACDVTSSLAGIELPIAEADIWYGSVQKCFGMPAGLGLLICSPRAIARAQQLKENGHYNSLTVLIENMAKWQTSCTPNVLGIYLLNRIMKQVVSIDRVSRQIKARAGVYYGFLASHPKLELLITNTDVRSDTVIAVKGNEATITDIKAKAKEKGILLGAGYGAWKANTFRIANFPAIPQNEIDLLLEFLNSYK